MQRAFEKLVRETHWPAQSQEKARDEIVGSRVSKHSWPQSFILHRALNFNERVDTVPKVVPSEVVYGAVNGGC